MQKRKIKKKIKKDYSILTYGLILSFFVIIPILFYMYGNKKEEDITPKTNNNRQTNVQIKNEQTQAVKQESRQILPAYENYKFKYTYTINISGPVKNFNLEIPIPQNEEDKQYILNYQTSIKPTRIYNDGVNTIAQFNMQNVENQKIILTTEGIAKIRTYNIKTAQAMNQNKSPEKDLSKYLKPEPYIESNDPYIISIANKIKGNTKEEIIQNIYEYAQKNITYRIIPMNIGAKKALQIKQGKCTEFSNIMAALCRAKKIPARIVLGNIARDTMTQHNWVEVYFDKYGWVSYDPTTMATVINVMDAHGKLIRQEKRFDTSNDNLRYIASGRNKYSTYDVSYSVSDRRNGNARVTEKIEISKI